MALNTFHIDKRHLIIIYIFSGHTKSFLKEFNDTEIDSNLTKHITNVTKHAFCE